MTLLSPGDRTAGTKFLRGFTLIEISIVLVIIAFIIAGILVGNTMIRQSQINSVLSDEQRYKTAILQFQQKYAYLPGDFPNATTYWGSGGSCPQNPGVSNATCNGNGDGMIEANLGSGNYWGLNWESAYLWNHLMMAGYIAGNYIDGYIRIGSNVGYYGPGITYPQSKIANAGFQVIYLGYEPKPQIYFDPTTTPAFNGSYGHVMTFGMAESGWINDSSYTGNPQYPVFTTQEALAIDQKLDDGVPYSGAVMAEVPSPMTYSNNCTVTSGSIAVYDKSQGSNLACSLIFLMQDF